MILDGHIHILSPKKGTGGFLREIRRAGIEGGIIISLPPAAFPAVAPSASPQARMKHLLHLCRAAGDLYPFYWIDPLEADAADQVAMAIDQGAMGFKVICDRYYPGDERAIAIFTAIAKAGKPILFHSGILWDGKPSSRFNRPAEFEPLMEVKGLRFSLAHIAWPWCDELIAVYGKFLNAPAGHSASGVEMFIDITPGTPPLYRKEALTKLFTIGYDIENNVIFGTDSCTHPYNVSWARQWIERDRHIFEELGLSRKTLEAVQSANLKRFVGLSSTPVRRKAPKPGM
jgi:predicted TIM-barrel fold metal-dependent hydrolase